MKIPRFLFMVLLSNMYSTWAKGDRVLATTKRQFPNALPGKTIEIKKVILASTGLPGIISSSPVVKSGNDLVALEREEERRLRVKYGAVGESLRKKFDAMREADTVRVNVYVKYPPGITYLNKMHHSMEELKQHSKQISRIQPVRDVRDVLLAHGISAFDRFSANVGACTVTKAKLRKLAEDPDIGSIGPYISFRPAFRSTLGILPAWMTQTVTPLSSLAASAYSHSTTAPPALAGLNVNSATFEAGLSSGFLACSNLNPIVWEAGNFEHSEVTFLNMTYAAPSARSFHHSDWRYNSQDDQDFLIDNSILTVSSSTYREGLSGIYHPLTATAGEFIIMDDFSYRYPFPFFVTATANNGWQFEAHWQGYNSINVGNVRHSDYQTFEIGEEGGATMTRNPEQRYGGPCLRGTDAVYSYCSSDREMPHIVAPGWSPTAYIQQGQVVGALLTDACIATPQTWGTSMSAPTLNGMAANVIAARPGPWGLTGWPEKVRAILLLTAENVDGPEWSASTYDGLDGAGVVNGAQAVAYAQSYTDVDVDNPAVENGLAAGYLGTSNWSTPLNYNVKIPNALPYNQHLRLVLTWSSNPVVGQGINALSDIDLSWNGHTRASTSWNGNVEIIDVPAAEVTPGATYQVSIARYLNRIPAGARTDYFYYSLAWGWVDDHAP